MQINIENFLVFIFFYTLDIFEILVVYEYSINFWNVKMEKYDSLLNLLFYGKIYYSDAIKYWLK